MSFLRRFLGGQASSPPSPDPVDASIRRPTAFRGQIYVRDSCPFCETTFEKLPVRTGRPCPACGEAVARINHVDRLVYLVRPSEAGPFEDEANEWDRVDRQWSLPGGRWDPAARRRLTGRFLRRYASLAIDVALDGSDHCCRACSALRHIHAPREAPGVPYEGCRNRSGYCLCRWRPVPPGESPVARRSNTVRIEL